MFFFCIVRFADQSGLLEPRIQKKYGERAFSVAGLRLWNNLPMEIERS